MVSSLSKQVIAEIPDELADFEALVFDQLGSLDCLWSELLQLHQLGIRENHSDAIIQIVHPLPYFVFIHTQLKHRVENPGHSFFLNPWSRISDAD